MTGEFPASDETSDQEASIMTGGEKFASQTIKPNGI
jgi:hypothetical protein